MHEAVELKFGLAGVLSTVTMGETYAWDVATQLIPLPKLTSKLVFFHTVNIGLLRHEQCGDIGVASGRWEPRSR